MIASPQAPAMYPTTSCSSMLQPDLCLREWEIRRRDLRVFHIMLRVVLIFPYAIRQIRVAVNVSNIKLFLFWIPLTNGMSQHGRSERWLFFVTIERPPIIERMIAIARRAPHKPCVVTSVREESFVNLAAHLLLLHQIELRFACAF
jgi:hypothetical protein